MARRTSPPRRRSARICSTLPAAPYSSSKPSRWLIKLGNRAPHVEGSARRGRGARPPLAVERRSTNVARSAAAEPTGRGQLRTRRSVAAHTTRSSAQEPFDHEKPCEQDRGDERRQKWRHGGPAKG